MKLVRVSVFAIAGCVTVLFAVVVVGLHTMDDIFKKQSEMQELMDFQYRVGEFSAASDELLTTRADPSELDTYLAEAEALKKALNSLAGDRPAARRAIIQVELLTETVSGVYSQPSEVSDKTDAQRFAESPVLLPLRSQRIMTQVADYGIELDKALREVTRHRHARIVQDANRIAAGFAGMAGMFGVFCILAFILIYNRINGPLRALSKAASKVKAGDSGVRVPVEGSDEFAELGHTFNGMLDQQEQLLNNFSEALATRRALIDSLPAHIALLDATGEILDVNDQWRHYGATNDQKDAAFGVGSNYLSVCRAAEGDDAKEALDIADGVEAVLAGDAESFALEYPCHSPDRLQWFRMAATRLVPGPETEDGPGAVVMHVDISERKLAEQELKRLAYQDPLTGLNNRLGFTQAFRRNVARRGWNAQGVVALLDIRKMRNINDTHGYDVGDKLLMGVARRLEERLEDGSEVGRISGDRFIVFLPDADTASPTNPLDKLAGLFLEPIHLSEFSMDVAMCYGYTVLGDDERGSDALIHEVEIALDEGRRANAKFNRYDQKQDWIAKERIKLAEDLRLALERDQFELHYQPQVDLATGEVIACEALIRWMHPERGMQLPGQFIGVAEQSKLIVPIGNWVLFEACRHLREWQDAGLAAIKISLNVSVEQLRMGDFPCKVRDALETHDIDPAALTLEITESMFSTATDDLRNQLDELRAMGVRVALDDFGTGYSSLLYLQQYPFDEIKIDMGFVRNLLDAPFNQKIVTMILGISWALSADTVAEGVEHESIRDTLLELGCKTGQGYHYSMPLEVEDFRWLLEQRARLPLASSPASDVLTSSMG
ncbi:EAL domain-containing protein [Roseovarius tibetensis]|uniref:EAL domain-containing protein n=1 Tax=Roseovarius tibetensis TaxID=2685897 RepID=UPI003D7FE338